VKWETFEFDGVFLGQEEKFNDERGSYQKIWDCTNFIPEKQFLINEIGIARNSTLGTLRGLHFQTEPFSQEKIVICTTGTVQDVIVHLNPNAKNFMIPQVFMLGEGEKYQALVVPRNHAHGYLTLTNIAEVLYLFDVVQNKGAESGLRWNDPKLGIPWKIEPQIISQRDLSWELA
jgi:dTDP-4-dehydrorhamnose 3,5-epimerase